VLRGINGLLASLDQHPMPAMDGRTLSQAEGITAVIYPMYAPFLWRELRGALRDAVRGDGTGLLQIADFANGRIGPDRYETNMLSAFYATSCWDSPAAPGRAGLARAAREWSADARVPEVAQSLAWGNAPCSTWYGHASRPPGPVVTTTTQPILVVGTTFDPATPYAWSVSLAEQIPTARLLTFRGDGHTAYGSGSRCADDAIDAYLLSGTLPAAGTVCR
jgi:pimeloyl-ACP methyl ester carboxylesterase